MAERTNEPESRLRHPRFNCGGTATFSCLPSNGIFLPGKILNLSLGGCCVDTTLPIDHGVRAELVVHVNSASFRAVGEVKGRRGHSEACIEFVYLSRGGKSQLADVLAELARSEAAISQLKSARYAEEMELFRRRVVEEQLLLREAQSLAIPAHLFI
ncbi:MAG TPA: PilZ domain-containing protein [Terriglobales bacterium]|jgi:hypothetical protein|nr:PilZ domain-containing protein [Terriglobales bacterium]